MADASMEVLIQIREELAGLNRTRAGITATKKEAEGLGAALKQGLMSGAGMEIARRGLDMLTSSFSASIGKAFRLAEEIKDQSEALGITSEAYQVLRYELAQAGVEASRLTMAISTQTQGLAQARSGAGAAAEAYKALGLQAAQLEALTPEQRLAAVARAVLNASDKTRAFQAAGEILGTRGLPQLLNGLRNLAANGYDAVAVAARNAGKVMADETIELLDNSKKRLENFQETTLPIAAGSLIGWAHGSMEWVGGTLANAVNFAQGMPAGHIERPRSAPRPPPAVGAPANATSEKILTDRIEALSGRASAIQGNSLITEAQQRRELLPIIEQQVALYEKLAEARFGKKWQEQRSSLSTKADSGSITESELATLKEMENLNWRIYAAKVERMHAVDTPMLALNRELLDTTGLIEKSLAGGVNSAMGALSSNIWGALQGTNRWSDAWISMGNIAGQILTDLMVKLLIIRPLLSLFGLGDVATVIPGVAAPVRGGIVGGGGGTFLTRGPTSLTVGDNPGGIELVTVKPLSGIGHSTVSGSALRMAGGGTALVGGAAAGLVGETTNVHLTFNGGVSREEVLGLVPVIVEASKAGVQDARRRRRGGHQF